MNNLLFVALCLLLIYYFYRPHNKNNANRPFKHQTTQTDPLINRTQYTQTDELKESKATQTETDELIDPRKDELIRNFKEDLTDSKKDKRKLEEQVNFFTQNKGLIKEAVEMQLNFAQSLTTRNTELQEEELIQELKEVSNLSEEELQKQLQALKRTMAVVEQMPSN
jgi:hypothetical protein